jgi:thymidylate synthase (FAD)
MRPLINVGTSARPRLTHGSEAQYKALVDRMTTQYEEAYEAYEASLEDGIAKEVARSVLPVGIYSSMYATANLRSIMHFLSLRTDSTVAMFPSKPQYEIAEAAERVEHLFHINFPDTHNAWHTNGRVAP